MSWSGGTYTKGNNGTGGWVGDASLGIGIEAGRHDTQDNDFATGINQCLNKDGSNAATANLNFGGFLPTNIGAGTAAAPAICAGGDVNTGIFSPAADQIGIATNGTEKVRIDSTGKVGIGTSGTPITKLEIVDPFQDFTGLSPETKTPLLIRTSDTATANYGGNLLFGANYTGTTYYPTAGIKGALTTTGALGGYLAFYTTTDTSGLVTERLRIDKAGFVFINTTSNFSADKLCLAFGSSENGLGIRDNVDTSGTTFAVFRNSTNEVCGSVTRVTTTNAVNYNTSSDYRLKENVAPLPNGLQRVLSLNPVEFKWIGNSELGEGFIAHEMATVMPQAVSGEKDAVDADDQPKYQGVDYGKLTPLLTAAIQELNAKVEALEAKVAELEA